MIVIEHSRNSRSIHVLFDSFNKSIFFFLRFNWATFDFWLISFTSKWNLRFNIISIKFLSHNELIVVNHRCKIWFPFESDFWWENRWIELYSGMNIIWIIQRYQFICPLLSIHRCDVRCIWWASNHSRFYRQTIVHWQWSVRLFDVQLTNESSWWKYVQMRYIHTNKDFLGCCRRYNNLISIVAGFVAWTKCWSWSIRLAGALEL